MLKYLNKIEKLIKEFCHDGVEFKELWEVTVWDKRFNGVDKEKQTKVLSFKHISSNELKRLETKDGEVKLLSTGKFNGWTTKELAGENINKGEIISIPSGGSADIKYYEGFFVDSGNILASSCDEEILNLKYCYYYLLTKNELIESYFRGAGVKHPNMAEILKIKIPLPPLDIQKEIAKILNEFTELEAELEAELESRKKQYEYYRRELLKASDKTELITLGEIGRVSMCKRIYKNQTSPSGDIPFYKIGTFGQEPNAFISRELYEKYKDKYPYPNKGDILLSASGTIGRRVIYDGEPAYYQDSNIIWFEHDEKVVLNKYLYHLYAEIEWDTEGGTIKRLYNDNLKKVSIPIPPLSEQKRIVSILDKFDSLVNDISIGLPAELKARRKQYEYYRNKLLTFKEYGK